MRRLGSFRVGFAVTTSLALVVAFGVPLALGAGGDLDPTFGVGGQVTTAFPGGSFANAVAIQSDGKIVVVGAAAGPSVRGEFAVARYETDGLLDPTFGDGGMVVTRYHGAVARAVALQPNGRIVVAGYNTGLALARYRPDGRLDRTFAGNGRIGTAVVGRLWALAVALQPDGRIVVAGGWDIFNVGLARFRVDGRLDPTFGDDGVLVADMGGGEQALTGLVIQPDGKIVTVGGVGPHEGGDTVVSRFVLARCRRNGSLDPTFGGDGKIETFFDGRSDAQGVALQADGRIVVVGGADDGTAQAFALARYLD